MNIQNILVVNFSELPGAGNDAINDSLCETVDFGDGNMCCLSRDEMLGVLFGHRSRAATAMRKALKDLDREVWVNLEK